MCGYKFGMRWQIVPQVFFEMMMDKDADKSKRVMNAMMQMGKLDVAKLKEAYDG